MKNVLRAVPVHPSARRSALKHTLPQTRFVKPKGPAAHVLASGFVVIFFAQKKSSAEGAITEAIAGMIINHADRLHEGIANG
jgi:hypothetical protein